MMDTDAIYITVCAYGSAKRHGWKFESDDYLEDIKRLLNEADEEHKSLLAENERLVDEINEARQEISEQARVCAMGAEREARLMARVDELERTLTHIHGVALAEDHRDLPGIAKDAKAALEKKHESDH